MPERCRTWRLSVSRDDLAPSVQGMLVTEGVRGGDLAQQRGRTVHAIGYPGHRNQTAKTLKRAGCRGDRNANRPGVVDAATWRVYPARCEGAWPSRRRISGYFLDQGQDRQCAGAYQAELPTCITSSGVGRHRHRREPMEVGPTTPSGRSAWSPKRRCRASGIVRCRSAVGVGPSQLGGNSLSDAVFSKSGESSRQYARNTATRSMPARWKKRRGGLGSIRARGRRDRSDPGGSQR
jgi:hypothetical protein